MVNRTSILYKLYDYFQETTARLLFMAVRWVRCLAPFQTLSKRDQVSKMYFDHKIILNSYTFKNILFTYNLNFSYCSCKNPGKSYSCCTWHSGPSRGILALCLYVRKLENDFLEMKPRLMK